jgi:hypothetical protein
MTFLTLLSGSTSALLFAVEAHGPRDQCEHRVVADQRSKTDRGRVSVSLYHRVEYVVRDIAILERRSNESVQKRVARRQCGTIVPLNGCDR